MNMKYRAEIDSFYTLLETQKFNVIIQSKKYWGEYSDLIGMK